MKLYIYTYKYKHINIDSHKEEAQSPNNDHINNNNNNNNNKHVSNPFATTSKHYGMLLFYIFSLKLYILYFQFETIYFIFCVRLNYTHTFLCLTISHIDWSCVVL